MNSFSMSEFPHNCVGVLYFTNKNKLMVGTGFLIASDLVLTVAHNIYSKWEKAEHKNLVFYPGVSGDLYKSNAYKVACYRYPE
jgi:V8-like Glu-specific endopeptidase